MKATKDNLVRTSLFYVAFLLASVVLISCASEDKSRSTDLPTDLPDEVSLKADRSDLAELRNEVPEDRRRENDELAAILQMMNSNASDEEPSKVRDRFNKAIRERRDKNDKSLRQRRDEFTKKERRAREEFLEKSKDERESFTRSKRAPEERRKFFDRQEDTRKAYFDKASDERKDFEAKMTEDRKTFEDYSREKTNQFNDLHRAYSAQFYDRKKNLELKKRMESKAKELERREQPQGASGNPASVPSGGADPLDEWRSIPKTPGTYLGPSDQ